MAASAERRLPANNTANATSGILAAGSNRKQAFLATT
jgi:hypothetical protein